MKTIEIKGELQPANPEAVTYLTSHYIYKGLQYTQLNKTINKDTGWEKGYIQVDAKVETPAEFGITGETFTKESLTIASRLGEFVASEKVADLALHGKLTFTLNNSETREVHKVLITVKEGKVSTQQANYIWTEPVTV
jgi:hypothetical protein